MWKFFMEMMHFQPECFQLKTVLQFFEKVFHFPDSLLQS